MRDLSYEQGVLRAIGLTQEQSKRLFYYEAFCIVLTAFISGIFVGLIANLFVSATFGELIEIPLLFIVPWVHILFILLVIAVSTYIAVRIPANEVNKRQISQVLKGTQT